MALINVENLARYLELGYNVLLEGQAGVGKTAVITEVFKNIKWKYFSAATLDPWVDFIGVPRPVKDEKNGGEVLDMVLPRFVKDDEVEAIFLDELNRAPDKVLNAVMELIQFKSINGCKFKNLRVIWAAINPADDDGDYTVSRLDRALRDRFQVQIEVPYKIDVDFFRNKYPSIADAMIGWWDGLPDAVKKEVSPRRCDYVAHAYLNGCHLSDFLPAKANIAALKKAIKALPFRDQLLEIETPEAAKKFLKEFNHATKLLQLVNNKDQIAQTFFKQWKSIMPQELIDALAPHIAAGESGARITTLAELLPTLKGPIREVINTINEVQFAYVNGRTLADEVEYQVNANTELFRSLATDIIYFMSTAPESILRPAMFKNNTNDNSNLTLIAKYIAYYDTIFIHISKEQRKKINAHTFLLKCAPAGWM